MSLPTNLSFNFVFVFLPLSEEILNKRLWIYCAKKRESGFRGANKPIKLNTQLDFVWATFARFEISWFSWAARRRTRVYSVNAVYPTLPVKYKKLSGWKQFFRQKIPLFESTPSWEFPRKINLPPNFEKKLNPIRIFVCAKLWSRR